MDSNCFSARKSRSSLPSPQPRSSTRFAPVALITEKTVCSRWVCRVGARSTTSDSKVHAIHFPARSVVCEKTAQSFSGEVPLTLQIARDDQVSFRMLGQPAFAPFK